MTVGLEELDEFFQKGACVLVKICAVKGSTPREMGAWMLVNQEALLGTIGGGQLEFIGIDTARQMLRSGKEFRSLDVPLGPEIGQCCGGHVTLELRIVSAGVADEMRRCLQKENDALLHVYVMGAGHVGRALAHALAPLPFKTIIVDTRPDALVNIPVGVEKRLVVLPEAVVRGAPMGSAFVILTHDHALDFLIAGEALARGDAAYVGMIGSRTKRAAFLSHLKQNEALPSDETMLICPIGGDNLADKRPQVIAALVASEILVHTGQPQKNRSAKADRRRAYSGGN